MQKTHIWYFFHLSLSILPQIVRENKTNSFKNYTSILVEHSLDKGHEDDSWKSERCGNSHQLVKSHRVPELAPIPVWGSWSSGSIPVLQPRPRWHLSLQSHRHIQNIRAGQVKVPQTLCSRREGPAPGCPGHTADLSASLWENSTVEDKIGLSGPCRGPGTGQRNPRLGSLWSFCQTCRELSLLVI